ncbi:MAG: potassium-transporting ATPase subunit KdpA, partial [Alphaproteobacteria bacterium]|nr:potassium-transporting ATPase subunit KdpA [Alphaproteobacteria bacterium]
MTANGWIQIAIYSLIIIGITAPLGGYMTRVFNGERTLLSPCLRPLERAFYRAAGVDEADEQNWVTYTIAMLVFSFAGFVLLYALQRLQAALPFNPAHLDAVSPDLA